MSVPSESDAATVDPRAGMILPNFMEIFLAARPRLLRWAESKLRNRGLAEDIVQMVFLRLWERLPEVDCYNLVAYINKTLFHLLADFGRRKDPGSNGADVDAHIDELFHRPTALDVLVARERITIAIDALTDVEREALFLRLDGASFREIATALGRVEETTKTRVRRAREKAKASDREVA